jgi:hypothetical protein
VIGKRPEGFALPDSTSAMAHPPTFPEYQACTMAGALSFHGISTGLPVCSTTTVFGFAAITASMIWRWPQGRLRSAWSWPSDPF